jgi:hypothetical protein
MFVRGRHTAYYKDQKQYERRFDERVGQDATQETGDYRDGKR